MSMRQHKRHKLRKFYFTADGKGYVQFDKEGNPSWHVWPCMTPREYPGGRGYWSTKWRKK